jgi:low affinity Fe/Cu permease
MSTKFSKLAHVASIWAGNYIAFIVALAIVVVWAASGPLFAFSGTWQLVINTGTTIITFLMVFLVQNSQNRDSQAIHVKLDEIINAIKDADDTLIDAEEDTQEELDALKKKYAQLSKSKASCVPEIPRSSLRDGLWARGVVSPGYETGWPFSFQALMPPSRCATLV